METQGQRTSSGKWQKRIERWRDSGLTAEQFAAELRRQVLGPLSACSSLLPPTHATAPTSVVKGEQEDALIHPSHIILFLTLQSLRARGFQDRFLRDRKPHANAERPTERRLSRTSGDASQASACPGITCRHAPFPRIQFPLPPSGPILLHERTAPPSSKHAALCALRQGAAAFRWRAPSRCGESSDGHVYESEQRV